MSLFSRLREGLRQTSEQLVGRFDDLARHADEPARRSQPAGTETIEGLEELLISADVGVAATGRILAAVRERSGRGQGLRELITAEILDIFGGTASPPANGQTLRVILVVGVNGTGKTTTVGKLARLLRSSGVRALICAGDTFRAAAVEQLEVWAQRANVDIVRARAGADPAAVVFDAITSGKARESDAVIVDTAGRLHTRVNLMAELEKIRRDAAREVHGAPHEVLLVVDATVGQNGLIQARKFMRATGVNGIVLAKVDGTAKGGIAIAIEADLKIPIRYVGVGEGIEDLLPFSARDYVTALFEKSW